MFLGGAVYFANHVSHVQDRVRHLARHVLDAEGALPEHRQVTEFVNCQGYQIAQSLFAQADGGLFGQGFGRRCWSRPAAGRCCRRRTPT